LKALRDRPVRHLPAVAGVRRPRNGRALTAIGTTRARWREQARVHGAGWAGFGRGPRREATVRLRKENAFSFYFSTTAHKNAILNHLKVF
jgi:hypothetical protein